MKLTRTALCLVVLTCFSILFFGRLCFADVSPGDVIDKSNWQKVEGMLIPSLVDWIKNGDMVIKIGALKYNPGEINAKLLGGKQAIGKNIGKYALKDRRIVDAKTGGDPGFIKGIPFPDLNPKDPDVGLKFVYDREYMRLNYGNMLAPFSYQFVGSTGLEREAQGDYYNYPLDGYPPAEGLPNPEKLWRHNLSVFHTPFDIAGTSLMCWRYKGEQQDVNFAYVPSIRRVRRMTPGMRSDSIIGSDICYDDAWGFDAKVSDLEWKFVRIEENLMPFLSEDYEKLVKDAEMGGWKSTSDIKAVEFGFHKPEWNGHKWVPLNVVWVKRPVMVVEARSRDEYYNFGSYTFHYDMETPSFIRDVKDRNGVHWKTMFMLSGALRTDDGEMALLTAGSMVTADDRLKHATIIEAVSPGHIWHYFANFDANRFSLAGYAAFCK